MLPQDLMRGTSTGENAASELIRLSVSSLLKESMLSLSSAVLEYLVNNLLQVASSIKTQSLKELQQKCIYSSYISITSRPKCIGQVYRSNIQVKKVKHMTL